MAQETISNIPTQQLLRRGRLREWTGWSNEYIALLVEEGRLQVWRLRPNTKPLYFTESVLRILNGKR